MVQLSDPMKYTLYGTRAITVLLCAYVAVTYAIALGVAEINPTQADVLVSMLTSMFLPVLPLLFQPVSAIAAGGLAWHTYLTRVKRSAAPPTVHTLSGRMCLVTGGTMGGIGYAVARELAAHGATVVLTGVDGKSIYEAVTSIRESTGNARVYGEKMDLASKADVQRLSKFVARGFPRLDVLVNNAGVLLNVDAKVVHDFAGVDHVTAVNFAGPFLLTRLLGPHLLRSARPKIVNVCSSMHMRPKTFDFTTLGPSCASQSKLHNYSHSKLALAMFTACLRAQGLEAACVHPGFVDTRITRDLPPVAQKARAAMGDGMRAWSRTPEAGASMVVALASGAQAMDALYFDHDGSKPAHADTRDDDKLTRLWERASEVVGLEPE
jgi:NAD(P)-dependent dehydrogenase (short-subunit alcohol dehydrogenase family)